MPLQAAVIFRFRESIVNKLVFLLLMISTSAGAQKASVTVDAAILRSKQSTVNGQSIGTGRRDYLSINPYESRFSYAKLENGLGEFALYGGGIAKEISIVFTEDMKLTRLETDEVERCK